MFQAQCISARATTNWASSNYINKQAVSYQVQPQRDIDAAQVATDKLHAGEIVITLFPGDKPLEGHKVIKNIRTDKCTQSYTLHDV